MFDKQASGLVALSLLLVASASADSWLEGRFPAPPVEVEAQVLDEAAPGSTVRDPLAVTPLAPLALPYQHPFSPVVHDTIRLRASTKPEARKVYLVRSKGGPVNPRENRIFVTNLQHTLPRYGLHALDAPPHGGVPFTPLMAIARYQPTQPEMRLPNLLELVEVTQGRVRVSLLGLQTGDRPSREVVLGETDPLEPGTTLARAAALLAELRTAHPQGSLSRASIQERWPRAYPLLADLDDAGLVLAVRVTWDAGDGIEIPGPGGVMVTAVDPKQALPRLYALYEVSDR